MKYDIILADPPWWYANRKTGGERKNKTRFGGGAQKHYPLLKAHEIIDPSITLDVPAICAENCALFMWVTLPLLYDLERRRPGWKPTEQFKAPHDALTVIQGWGFRNYATAPMVWIKTTRDRQSLRYGPGGYTASNAEMVIVATKGKGMTPKAWGGAQMLGSVILAPRGRHSEKPADVHQMIEVMYPNARKIELFARAKQPGWDAWGNQVGVLEGESA